MQPEATFASLQFPNDPGLHYYALWIWKHNGATFVCVSFRQNGKLVVHVEHTLDPKARQAFSGEDLGYLHAYGSMGDIYGQVQEFSRRRKTPLTAPVKYRLECSGSELADRIVALQKLEVH